MREVQQSIGSAADHVDFWKQVRELLPNALEKKKVENELKFLVTEIPDYIQRGIREGSYTYEVITQGYTRMPREKGEKKGRRVRSRESWNGITGRVSHVLTDKKRHDWVSSLEDEREISLGFYSEVWQETSNRALRKIRFYIPLDVEGVYRSVELDVYLGPLQGLVTAEIEFKSREEAAQFHERQVNQKETKRPLEDLLGADLTMNASFKSSQLAKTGTIPGPIGNTVCNNFAPLLPHIRAILNKRKKEAGDKLSDKNYPDIHADS